jgi:hypothetical protein
MDTWTPEENSEWQRRWDASEEGSIERQELMGMQYDGFYRPTEVSSLPASPTSPFGEPAGPPKPPLRPIKAVDPQRELFYLNRTSKDITGKPLRPIEQSRYLATRRKQVPNTINPAGIAMNRTRRNIGKLNGGRGKTYKSKKGGEIVSVFFHMRSQIKLYHWQTRSFAEHKATDDLVEALDTNIDKFIEVYMGRYGRPYIRKTLPVKNLTVTGIRAFITKSDEWLASSLPRMLKKTDSDLLNIRDEILADLNQIKYLFTLA